VLACVVRHICDCFFCCSIAKSLSRSPSMRFFPCDWSIYFCFFRSGAFVSALNELARDQARKGAGLNELCHDSRHLGVLQRGPFIMPGTLARIEALDIPHSKCKTMKDI
jgi:hypothetical protein